MNLSDSAIGANAAPQGQQAAAPRTVLASSPIQLRAAAHLYGIETVPLAEARVLELGCGLGDNLLPFALAWPTAQVVGIDANASDIAVARAAAQRLGATNVQFHVMDEVDLGAGLQFDYIVLHQTYGSVPDELGQALLALCKQWLSPLGVAFVSYHTLPGWKGRDVLRDAMQFAGHAATGMAESIAEARTMLTLLNECATVDGRHTGSLAPILEYARGLSDDELVTEFLQDPAPTASYFIEFANGVLQHGLMHIGDAEPQQEMPQTFGRNVALFSSLKGLGQTAAVRQQYLDFAVGRRFRQSMLVHEDRGHQCLTSPDLTRLESLRFAGMFRQHRPAPGQPLRRRTFSNQDGHSLVSEDRHVAAVIAALTAAWPASCSMKDLIDAMPERPWEKTDVLQTAVRKALEVMLRAGVLRIAHDAVSYDRDEGARMDLLPHLRQVLQNHPDGGTIDTWTLWHAPVQIALSHEEVSYLLRDGLDLTVEIALAAKSGQPAAAPAAGVDVGGLAERLRERGLLSASPQAWVRYYRAQMARYEWRDVFWWQLLEAQFSHNLREMAAASRSLARAMTAPVRQALAAVNAMWKEARHGEAEAMLRDLLEQHPDSPEAWRSLARAMKDIGRGEEALTAMGRAVERKPFDPTYQVEFSDMLIEHRRYPSAEACARRALLLDPTDPVKFNRLALIFRWCRKFEAAHGCLAASLELNPKLDATYNMLGIVHSEGGDPDKSEAYYRQALELNPRLHSVRSNALFMMSHRSIYTPEQIFAEHKAFGAMATRRARGKVLANHPNSRDPDRPLRVGFVSGDLRRHAVMNFLEPIWQNLDREQFQLYAYHTGERDDATSERVKPMTTSWKGVRALGEAELRDTIASDEIDVLFDLSGHTDGNRLTTFAMRPAPVQVSWIGYPGTTGLAEMDYFITDSHAAEPGVLDSQFTEKLVYLPAAFAFEPSLESPEIGPSPARKNGFVTFGSFNRYSKITDDVLALWARVLHRVPDSKMLMGNMDAEISPKILERFAKLGIPAERIEIRSNAPMKTYLALHNEVDIMLDTFPYTGGTTTCHSLWMGVPVLSMRGATRVSRQTAGVLVQVGLQDWVAESPDDLVEKAARWAADLPELAAHRAGMRARIRASSMLRPDFVARGMERAIRKMWATWCARQPVTSFTIEP